MVSKPSDMATGEAEAPAGPAPMPVKIVVAGGFTPLPFKVVTIAAGFAQLDLGIFVAAALASRGLRFAIEAGLLMWFGPPIRAFIERRLALVAALSFLVLVAAVVVLRWLW